MCSNTKGSRSQRGVRLKQTACAGRHQRSCYDLLVRNIPGVEEKEQRPAPQRWCAMIRAVDRSSGATLLGTLLSLASKLGQRRRTDLRALSRLATKKFSELERTHNLFVAILERLQKDIQLLANESSQWQKDPTKLIKRLDKSLHSAKSWRRKGQIK